MVRKGGRRPAPTACAEATFERLVRDDGATHHLSNCERGQCRRPRLEELLGSGSYATGARHITSATASEAGAGSLALSSYLGAVLTRRMMSVTASEGVRLRLESGSHPVTYCPVAPIV
jgi:hypothetical protein